MAALVITPLISTHEPPSRASGHWARQDHVRVDLRPWQRGLRTEEYRRNQPLCQLLTYYPNKPQKYKVKLPDSY